MRALITGITGQDGYALAGHLLTNGWRVAGLMRWVSRHREPELHRDLAAVDVIYGDLTDETSLVRALETVQPDVVFHLGALASSGQSWTQPVAMLDHNAGGTLKLLEAIRKVNTDIRIVHASTSEQYGYGASDALGVKAAFRPMNVYGVAKTFAHQSMIVYRDSFGIHASNALMHNHVSLRRNDFFVDRKITKAAARIKIGHQSELRLGRLDVQRDWGWGPEFMTAWPIIAQYEEPDDYIIATGKTHSVQELVDLAFARVGLDPEDFIVRDERFIRPLDIPVLLGDPSLMRDRFGWEARVDFEEIVERLVDYDLMEAAA
jgi:GDPmannose 4,6-dehydratase